jgi:putative ATP-binding cassette transporter
VTIPAYMMLAAILYAVVASALAVRIGRPLVAGVAGKNEAEARLRFELTRIRENAESIALVRGERDERGLLDATYAGLVGRWLHVVGLHARLAWLTNGSGALVPVVPLLLATPKFLSGELSLGAVTQLAGAFVQVQAAVAWIVDNYKAIAQWRASAQRVMALADAVSDADLGAEPAIRVEASRDGCVVLDDLTVTDRAGRVLVDRASAVIGPGERVLLMGESGLGKSTLVRAAAGLWPWGRGRVALPGDGLAFVPQRPYLPLGSLRRALLYPAPEAALGEGEAAEALATCGLPHLVPRLDEAQRWDQVLSSGERQRLAFARLLLQRPATIILDEATSALDEAAQDRLMALLVERLPAATVISIGHRPGLEAFHDRRILLLRGEAGARLADAAPPRPLLALA